MGNKKDLKFDCMSEERYRELKYFCLQYSELKKQSLIALKCSEVISKKVELIEATAADLDPIVAPFLLKNVCQDTSFLSMQCKADTYCRIKYFYKLRREFFINLNLKKD